MRFEAQHILILVFLAGGCLDSGRLFVIPDGSIKGELWTRTIIAAPESYR